MVATGCSSPSRPSPRPDGHPDERLRLLPLEILRDGARPMRRVMGPAASGPDVEKVIGLHAVATLAQHQGEGRDLRLREPDRAGRVRCCRISITGCRAPSSSSTAAALHRLLQGI